MRITYNMLLVIYDNFSVIILNYLVKVAWECWEFKALSSSFVGPKTIMGFHAFLGLSIQFSFCSTILHLISHVEHGHFLVAQTIGSFMIGQTLNVLNPFWTLDKSLIEREREPLVLAWMRKLHLNYNCELICEQTWLWGKWYCLHRRWSLLIMAHVRRVGPAPHPITSPS